MARIWAAVISRPSGHFEPEKFEDHYENALHELLRKKQAGEKIRAPEQRQPSNVVNLMDALRKSVEAERGGSAGTSKPEAASSARRRGSETKAKPKRARRA